MTSPNGSAIPRDTDVSPEPRPAVPRRRTLSIDQLEAGVRSGNRALLGRAITLVESQRDDHREQAQELLRRLLPATGGARRVGITGVPGVGKSTFLEAFGMARVAAGQKVAVLAIDPSSSVSGGSILGDKTRMPELSSHPNAFVRPSPSGGSLGGVARKTRETLLLLEAAGYDAIFVETVGVGQSEIMVAEMVDTVLLLLSPAGGDELQGIKRGILEVVDVLAVNKADGDHLAAARRARQQYLSALKVVRPTDAGWRPPVLLTSGLETSGLDELWQSLEEHRRHLEASGELATRRRRQQKQWMWSLVEDELLATFRHHPRVRALLGDLEAQVEAGKLPPALAASRLLAAFRG